MLVLVEIMNEILKQSNETLMSSSEVNETTQSQNKNVICSKLLEEQKV